MNQKPISMVEFVILMASLTALGAMSTDAMLPALNQIGDDFGLKDANEAQFIIYSIFGGFGIGQIFYGPLSDSIGRKKSIYISLTIFIIGSCMSMVTEQFSTMLIGRFLQGFGASGPKIITMALIRDKYSGREMAKIMSFISIVFILVPAIAPMVGSFILEFGNWHHIFLMFILSASISFIWFGVRQKETLSPRHRKPLKIKTIIHDTLSILKDRKTITFTLILGIIFGVFVSYLSTAEQIFAIQYKLGDDFPLYFAFNALVFGLASLVNATFVEKFGMVYLCEKALITMVTLCAIFLMVTFSTNGHPSLTFFMIFCMSCFFCIGILFGNLNALAMEPMGKIAGTAATIIGAFSTLIALPIGITIGQFYDNSITPFVVGFTIASTVALPLFKWVNKK